jgi:fluoroquinolone transport system permease protein
VIAPGAVAAFARADVRALARDPLLRLILVAPIGLTGVLLLGVPLVENWAAGAFALDLAGYRPLVAAFIACVTMPIFLGAMAGLLMLEDRESGILPAVAVSPAGLRSYLVVRCGWAAGAAAVTIAGALALHGGLGVGALGVGALTAVALLGGGYAAVVALLVGSLAGDRLEGLVVVKALTLPLALVLLVETIDAPWSWLLAVLPSYAPVVALLDGMAGKPLAAVVAFGVLQLAVWLGLLVHRMVRRVG